MGGLERRCEMEDSARIDFLERAIIEAGVLCRGVVVEWGSQA